MSNIGNNPVNKGQGQNTNVWEFLKAVRLLQPVGKKALQILAYRFNIQPELLVILIEVHRLEGGFSWN